MSLRSASLPAEPGTWSVDSGSVPSAANWRGSGLSPADPVAFRSIVAYRRVEDWNRLLATQNGRRNRSKLV